jgi:hypothetical protein
VRGVSSKSRWPSQNNCFIIVGRLKLKDKVERPIVSNLNVPNLNLRIEIVDSPKWFDQIVAVGTTGDSV